MSTLKPIVIPYCSQPTNIKSAKTTKPAFSMLGERGIIDDQAIVDPTIKLEANVIYSHAIVSGTVDVEHGILTLYKADGTKVIIDSLMTYADYDNATQGPQGERGVDGLDGADGIDGIPGGINSCGISGGKGCTGDRGADGVPGAQGPKGLKGLKGPTGNYGPYGPKGSVGPAGRIGQPGPPGLKGPPGPVGLPGPTGEAGLSIVGVNCCENKLTLVLSDGTEQSVQLPDPALCPGHLAFEQQNWDNVVQTYGYTIDPTSSDTIINILQARLTADTSYVFNIDTITTVYNQYITDIQKGGLGRPPDYTGLRSWCNAIDIGGMTLDDFKIQFTEQPEQKAMLASGIKFQQTIPASQCLALQGTNIWPSESNAYKAAVKSIDNSGAFVAGAAIPNALVILSDKTYTFKVKWQNTRSNAEGICVCNTSGQRWSMGNEIGSVMVTANSPVLQFTWYCSDLGNDGISTWDWLIYEEGKPSVLLTLESDSLKREDHVIWTVDLTQQVNSEPSLLPNANYMLPKNG